MGKYCLSNPFVLSLFTPQIVGQGQTPLRVDAVEHSYKVSDCRSGSCRFHFWQCYEERASLNQRRSGRRIACTFDQIALPMDGMRRSSISAGRIWILAMFEMVLRRSAPLPRGRRLLLAWRRQAINSARDTPCGMAKGAV